MMKQYLSNKVSLRPTVGTLFLLVSTLTLAFCQQDSIAMQFERSFELEGAGCSNLQWTVDSEALKIVVSWTSSPGSEWTAFGISEFGGMKGADIAIVKHWNGKIDIEDSFSTNYELPDLDYLQNWELLGASYDDKGSLQVTARRDLDTCDKEDIPVKPHKQYLVCASGSLSSTGSMLYHGPNRATGLVNLMLDEELLFERNIQATDHVNASKTHLADGVMAWGDPTKSSTSFPVDIQMNNVTIPSDNGNHYRCRTLQVPETMKFTAWEGVWGERETPSNSRGSNNILHHATLYYCPKKTQLVESHLDGLPWNCRHEMPACDIAVTYVRGSGLVEAPAGTHFPLNTGTYVLLIHYENTFAMPIVNDKSGVRLWVEPSSSLSAKTSKEAQIVAHGALYNQWPIPADPEQKEVTLEYLISAEATRTYLPPGGVQAFGSFLHMHKLGVRGKVELIRNGTHIANVYDSKSYDFDRQSPDYGRWRFLPGDALIVSCTYKPLTDRDVYGGFFTDDEMCLFHTGWVPAVHNYGRAMGVMVKPGEPFLNTHMGDEFETNARFLNYTDYRFPPNPISRATILPLSDHQKNICDSFVRDSLAVNFVTFGDAAIYAQLLILISFVFVNLLSNKRCMEALGLLQKDLRDKRNVVVYIGQLVFSTVALPILCWKLAVSFGQDDTMQAVNPNQHIVSRVIVITQSILYLLELLYRIQIRFSLVMHHVATSLSAIYLSVMVVQSFNFLALKLGLALNLLAMTEQPLYVILLMRTLGFQERISAMAWRTCCRVACAIFVTTRLVVVALVMTLLVQQSGSNDSAWIVRETSFGDWYNPSGPFIENPKVVNSVMIILLLGILCSNFFAVLAMMHMSGPSRRMGRADAGSKGYETGDDSSYIQETKSGCRNY